MNFSILPVGDSAIQVFYDHRISESLHKRITDSSRLILEREIKGVLELVPGFNTITIYYNPLQISYERLYESITAICANDSDGVLDMGKEIIYIPTFYDGEDLERVALSNNLTVDRVIDLHSKQEYFVYLIGFLPGFPYLKGLRSEIHTPRLANPRLQVPQGSVGIGGDQTGIYPIESPGGWNLIGRTPVRLFDPALATPFLLKSGDYIRFKPINEEQFFEIEEAVIRQQYVLEREVIR
ncbi:5-oxoprolinase subunit PxpB [Fredinandcohnia quinoae]|uniref:5-oxoprolinase subunit PxpB n=1 Tax=Fredinandcohnia quinoae TaxID=2918902 RepID=A0AAW5E4J8_9BACI|nr:5-oxoprolinase subunit PxpB [Fredinandcohnia sp. SECRCQ15]MCH1626165.1 5-oxoprolinase subunit PxpB [Fredinandcohnia sp. SECRCQ15]